jgi:O-acetyl-ADP-ribose deacetylase (regulator of RNase III)
MPDQVQVKDATLRVVREDITLYETDAFVYYAQNDLQLGTGFGAAIAVRGGPSIQQELNEMGPVETCQVVISGAGKLPATYILHAVGPKFQEEEIEAKIETTVSNALATADEKGIQRIALPPMGRGFYGVPLAASAKLTVDAVKKYLGGETKIREVVICVNDHAEVDAIQANL